MKSNKDIYEKHLNDNSYIEPYTEEGIKKELSELDKASLEMVRKYCKEGKIPCELTAEKLAKILYTQKDKNEPEYKEALIQVNSLIIPPDHSKFDDIYRLFIEGRIQGMKLDEAKEILESENLRYRTANINGNAVLVTRDFKAMRVNLTVKEEVVTKITWG